MSVAAKVLKEHGELIRKAVASAKRHPNMTVPIGRLSVQPRRMGKALRQVTHCTGNGPYRWHRNPRGFWFLSYER